MKPRRNRSNRIGRPSHLRRPLRRTLEQLESRQLLAGEPLGAAGPWVDVKLITEDLSGNPITSIAAGADFQLEVDVQDIRNPPDALAGGVFSPFVNIGFDNTLATIAPNAALTFGPGFGDLGHSLSSDGLTSQFQVGAIGPVAPPGNGLQFIVRIPVHAVSAGAATFTSSFDSTGPGHDFLVFDPVIALTADQIAFGSASVTIVDTGQPTLVINSPSVPEGNDGFTPMVFTVRLSSPSDQTLTVAYSTADGTAQAGDNDYVPTSGTLTFAPGETTQFVTVPVVGDSANEDDETFSLLLSAAGPIGVDLVPGFLATGTIVNDDAPTVSITSMSLPEGNGFSLTPFVFTVSLSAPSALEVDVDFTASGDTATRDIDFYATSGLLIFAPGETTQTIVVRVVEDSVLEPDETFQVVLSPPSHALIAPGQGVGIGTIVNDDTLEVSISGGSATEGSTQTAAVVFTVSLSSAHHSFVRVHYETVDGTATAGSDYSPVTGFVSFPPGATTQLITVPVFGDSIAESNETFSVELDGADDIHLAGVLGTIAQGTIIDAIPPQLSITSTSATEGNSGASLMIFTVRLSAPSNLPVTVSYATTGGTASASSDYQSKSGVLTFAPGTTTQTIAVVVNGDRTVESDETFQINLGSAANAVIGTGTGAGTILNDDLAGVRGIRRVPARSGGSTSVPIPYAALHAQANYLQALIHSHMPHSTVTTTPTARQVTTTSPGSSIGLSHGVLPIRTTTKREVNEGFQVIPQALSQTSSEPARRLGSWHRRGR